MIPDGWSPGTGDGPHRIRLTGGLVLSCFEPGPGPVTPSGDNDLYPQCNAFAGMTQSSAQRCSANSSSGIHHVYREARDVIRAWSCVPRSQDLARFFGGGELFRPLRRLRHPTGQEPSILLLNNAVRPQPVEAQGEPLFSSAYRRLVVALVIWLRSGIEVTMPDWVVPATIRCVRMPDQQRKSEMSPDEEKLYTRGLPGSMNRISAQRPQEWVAPGRC